MFLTMDRTVNIYDEGIILTAAMRVAAGDIIHRDFYANYGPAEFYVVSWLLKAFGQSILPERIFDLSMRAGIATLIYSSLVYYAVARWHSRPLPFVSYGYARLAIMAIRSTQHYYCRLVAP